MKSKEELVKSLDSLLERNERLNGEEKNIIREVMNQIILYFPERKENAEKKQR